MPIYDYACESCGHVVEVIHSIAAAGPTTCERCGGTMKRALSVPAIVFKGSGWAKKDARDASRPKAPAAAGGDGPAAATGGASTATEPASGPADTGSSGKPAPATSPTGPSTSDSPTAASATAPSTGTSGGSGTTG